MTIKRNDFRAINNAKSGSNKNSQQPAKKKIPRQVSSETVKAKIDFLASRLIVINNKQ